MNCLLTTWGTPGTGAGVQGLLTVPRGKWVSDSPFLFLSAIASILRAWLDQCAEDFREPPLFPCLQKLLDYLKRMMPGSDPERRAQNLLEQFQKQDVETDSECMLTGWVGRPVPLKHKRMGSWWGTSNYRGAVTEPLGSRAKKGILNTTKSGSIIS